MAPHAKSEYVCAYRIGKVARPILLLVHSHVQFFLSDEGEIFIKIVVHFFLSAVRLQSIVGRRRENETPLCSLFNQDLLGKHKLIIGVPACSK